MLERHYSVAELCRDLGISRTTAWRLVRDGKLPKPVAVSERRRAWPESAVVQYLADRAGKAGAP